MDFLRNSIRWALILLGFTSILILAEAIYLSLGGAMVPGAGEAALGQLARWVAEDSNLYVSHETAPFDVVVFGPVFYGIVGGFIRLLGIDPSSPSAFFLAARIGALLVCAGWLATFQLFLTRFCRVPRRVALGVVVVNFALIHLWCVSVRPDFLAHLLVLGAIWAAYRAHESETLLPLLVSALCFSLAAFSKQDHLQWLGWLPLGIWLTHGFRRALLQGVVQSALLLLMAGTVHWIHGEAFWTQTFEGLANGVSLKTAFWDTYSKTALYFGPGILGGILACVFLLGRPSFKLRSRSAYLALLFALHLFTQTLAALKTGSSINYYFLPLALALALWSQMGRQFSPRWQAMAVLWVLFLIPVSLFRGWRRWEPPQVQFEREESLNAAYSWLDNTEGTFFTFQPLLLIREYDRVLMAGSYPYARNFETGFWSDEALRNYVQKGEMLGAILSPGQDAPALLKPLGVGSEGEMDFGQTLELRTSIWSATKN